MPGRKVPGVEKLPPGPDKEIPAQGPAAVRWIACGAGHSGWRRPAGGSQPVFDRMEHTAQDVTGPAPEPARILIVEAQPDETRRLETELWQLGYQAARAGTLDEALQQLTGVRPELILLDAGALDGEEAGFLLKLKTDERWSRLPLVIMGSPEELAARGDWLERGACDYLLKPMVKPLLATRIRTCLEVQTYRQRTLQSEEMVAQYTFNLEACMQARVSWPSEAQFATIFAMSKLAESRDDCTGKHLERVREYCWLLAERLAASKRFAGVVNTSFIENIYAASPLHDIGKVGIPDRILRKSGPLTEEEFGIMQTHTTIGANTLRAVERIHPRNEFLKMGIEIAEAHHEKWNGAGYPRGQREEAIPPAARIVAIADVYDALSSERPYKAALSPERCREIIVSGSGTHFDPAVVEAFVARNDEFLKVRESFDDRSPHAPFAAVDRSRAA
ncbi:MAG: HD domain-containing protein [Candidatus Eisenbacteria bacterium]|nr:HD domain-containing protein [Candidatus Eisenbacteria bacterium]